MNHNMNFLLIAHESLDLSPFHDIDIQWYIKDRVINPKFYLNQDKKDIIKDSAIVFLFYDPNNLTTVFYLKKWLKSYYGIIPASAEVNMISINYEKSPEINDLSKIYFTVHLNTIRNAKDFIDIAKKASLMYLEYIDWRNPKKTPGLSVKQDRRYSCNIFAPWV